MEIIDNMDIKIIKLTPEHTEDYVQFFDNTPHSEIPDNDECKCYCVWWCKDDQDNMVFDNFLSSKELRRDYAIRNIKNNNIQGYLAYLDGKVVGWCNTNTKSDCLKCYCWRRFMGSVPIEDSDMNIKVKSIFCFLIAAEMKRKGITKKILECVYRDAVQEGFDFIEAYPNKEYINEAVDFMGPVELYRKNGFTVYFEMEQKFIMRKELKI